MKINKLTQKVSILQPTRPLSPSLFERGEKRFLGSLRRPTASSPPSRGIPLLRRPLRRREGGGSPAPACTYGRVGWRSCRRRSGGGGAGGGRFGVGVFFSGVGAPRGSSSTRATCWISTPGVVLELLCFPSDLWWRWIWRPEPRVGQVLRLLLAADPKAAEAVRRCWSGGAPAVVVHRQKFRRGAADGLCGVFQRRGCPWAVARWRLAVFVFVAGEVAGFGASSDSPTCCSFFSVCVLCTPC